VEKLVKPQLQPVEHQRRVVIVPFLPFLPDQKRIIALYYQEKFIVEYISPPTKDRKNGDIELHFDPSFTDIIVERYDGDRGADGINKAIADKIHNYFYDYYLIQTPKPKHAWFYRSGKNATSYSPVAPDRSLIYPFPAEAATSSGLWRATGKLDKVDL
jgi:hypothetical protein